jgi:hypothetical protein
VKNPCTFIYYETLKSELNYGKPMINISYISAFSTFIGDNCTKSQLGHSLPYEDLQLENVTNRNYTVTCTFEESALLVVKLKAGEKKLITKKTSDLNYHKDGFSLIDIKYD